MMIATITKREVHVTGQRNQLDQAVKSYNL